MYCLPQVVFVALAVAYKDLQNVNIYYHKKDTHVTSMGFLLAKIYFYFWTPYGYLGMGNLHYTQGLPSTALSPMLMPYWTSATTGHALLGMAS